MKNKYVADINDFRKYGLLRALLASNGLKCGVFWLLTEADASNDGELVRYLKRPTRAEQLDSELFHKLRHMVHTHKDRTVARVRQETLLPRTQFFEDLIPDNVLARTAAFQKGLANSKTANWSSLTPTTAWRLNHGQVAGNTPTSFYTWKR